MVLVRPGFEVSIFENVSSLAAKKPKTPVVRSPPNAKPSPKSPEFSTKREIACATTTAFAVLRHLLACVLNDGRYDNSLEPATFVAIPIVPDASSPAAVPAQNVVMFEANVDIFIIILIVELARASIPKSDHNIVVCFFYIKRLFYSRASLKLQLLQQKLIQA